MLGVIGVPHRTVAVNVQSSRLVWSVQVEFISGEQASQWPVSKLLSALATSMSGKADSNPAGSAPLAHLPCGFARFRVTSLAIEYRRQPEQTRPKGGPPAPSRPAVKDRESIRVHHGAFPDRCMFSSFHSQHGLPLAGSIRENSRPADGGVQVGPCNADIS